MKMNDDKSHLLIFGNKENTSITIRQSPLVESKNEKLLGITVDKKLSFQAHIDNVCKKAGQKLYALVMVSKYMNEQQLRITMTSFVTSQFTYCQLVWMRHDRKSNNKINKIHERGLRLMTRDTRASFETLLENTESVSVHQKYLQVLMIEIYKCMNGLNPRFMKNIFVERELTNNLRTSKGIILP